MHVWNATDVILAAGTSEAARWWTWLYTVLSVAAFMLAILSIPSVLMQRRGRPQAALSWVLLLFLLPIVGLLFWWAIGRRHLTRKRRKRRGATERRNQRLAAISEELPDPPQASWDLLPVRRLPAPESEWFFEPTRDNQVHLLIDAKEAYPAMEKAFASARKFVHVLFYIWNDDDTGRRFRDQLTECAQRGVEVRVLFDAIGGSAVRGRFMQSLAAAGARVAAFAPPVIFRRSLELNFRNHRKLVVVDGKRAIIGGMNIGDEYLNRWRDIALRISGPAVDQLQEIFADDWYFATGDDFAGRDYFGAWCESDEQQTGHAATCGIVASGPHTEINLMHEAFFSALTRAEKRIWIATPYFVPDQSILAALRTAVFRGVDVQIIVPADSDNLLAKYAGRSYYPELLRAGARIFEAHGDFVHTKMTVIDESLSIVGSANMDIRSFRLNFELSSFIDSQPVVEELASLFESYLAFSREMSLMEVENKSYFIRLAESAIHLASPLL